MLFPTTEYNKPHFFTRVSVFLNSQIRHEMTSFLTFECPFNRLHGFFPHAHACTWETRNTYSLTLIQHDFIQSPASAVQAEKTGDDVITTRYWLGRIGKASPPSDKKKKAHKEAEKWIKQKIKREKDERVLMDLNTSTDISMAQSANYKLKEYFDAAQVWANGDHAQCEKILENPKQHGIAGFIFLDSHGEDFDKYVASFTILYFPLKVKITKSEWEKGRDKTTK